jgi:Holliday junction DNA helicase RuvA
LSEDEATIQSIKGIGPKSAKRLILELKDKVGKPSGDHILTIPANNTVRDEALSALITLGFNKQASEKALLKTTGGANSTAETLIKEALKLLR